MAGYGDEGVMIIDPYGDTLNDRMKPAGNLRYKRAHLFF
jgi:hypothetical protein